MIVNMSPQGRVRSRDFVLITASLSGTAVSAAVLHLLPGISPTTAALALLLIVLATATTGRLWIAIATAVVATLAFNYLFLPPVRTFTIADPQNWVAMVVFLITALIASNLSSAAKARADDAIASRNEVSRLFDLTRDVLLTTETTDAIELLVRHVARRFALTRVAIAVPATDGWRTCQGGGARFTLVIPGRLRPLAVNG